MATFNSFCPMEPTGHEGRMNDKESLTSRICVKNIERFSYLIFLFRRKSFLFLLRFALGPSSLGSLALYREEDDGEHSHLNYEED